MVAQQEEDHFGGQNQNRSKGSGNVFSRSSWFLHNNLCKHADEIIKAAEQDEGQLRGFGDRFHLNLISKPPTDLDSSQLGDEIEDLWAKNRDQDGNGAQRRHVVSLASVLYKTIRPDLVNQAIFYALSRILCLFLIFESSRRILTSIEVILIFSSIESNYKQHNSTQVSDFEHIDQYQDTFTELYLLLGIFMLSVIGHSIFYSYLESDRFKLGLKCRTSLSQLIFRKSLRLQLLATNSNEPILVANNLFKKEIELIDIASHSIVFILMGPMIFILTTIYLALLLAGWQPVLLSYIGFIIILMIKLKLFKYYENYSTKLDKFVSNRIENTRIYLNNIKEIKLFNWEYFVCDFLDNCRLKEHEIIKNLDSLKTLETVLKTFSIKIVPATIFIAYILLNHDINIKTLLITAMACPLVIHDGLFEFANGLKSFLDISKACKEIEVFLSLPEVEEQYNNIETKRKLLSIQKTISLLSASSSNSSLAQYQAGNFSSSTVSSSDLKSLLNKFGSQDAKLNSNWSASCFYFKNGCTLFSAVLLPVLWLLFSPIEPYTDFFLTIWWANLDAAPTGHMRKFDLYCGLIIYCSFCLLGSLVVYLFQKKLRSVLRRSSKMIHRKLIDSLFTGKMAFYDRCSQLNEEQQLGLRYTNDFSHLDTIIAPLIVECFMTSCFVLGLFFILYLVDIRYLALFMMTFVITWPIPIMGYKNVVKLMEISKILKQSILNELKDKKINNSFTSIDKINKFKDQFCQRQDRYSTVFMLIQYYKLHLITMIKVPTILTSAFMLYVLFYINYKQLNTGLGVFLVAILLVTLFFPLFAQSMGLLNAWWQPMQSIQLLLDLEAEEDKPYDPLMEERKQIEKQQQVKLRRANGERREWQIGRIEFKKVNLKYSLIEPAALQRLSFVISSGEHVGIVGSRGSGKSSLVNALFRLYPFEGTILIDGQDIRQIGLMELRSSLAIVSKNPILISHSQSTLRKNLDPFEEFEDGQLWLALEAVGMRQYVVEQFGANGLEQTLLDGNNFNLQHKKLITLARAILNKSKILVLDADVESAAPSETSQQAGAAPKATYLERLNSSDDLIHDDDFDSLLRMIIERHFKFSTVLMITNKPKLLLDFDSVMVLDGGKILEFDHVSVLLGREEGAFKKLLA